VLKLAGATAPSSTAHSPHPVIALITEWQDRAAAAEARREHDLGGTMRLGAQECRLAAGTLARELYGTRRSSSSVTATAYEFNNTYLEQLSNAGLKISGFSMDGTGRDRSSCRSIPGSWPASSTPSSPPRRATAIRCSAASCARRGFHRRRCRPPARLHEAAGFEVGADQPFCS
jgi:hypothetical protein